MSKLLTRAEQREWLLRLAYETEGKGMDQQKIQSLFQAHDLKPQDPYLEESLLSLSKHLEEIDQMIEQFLRQWRLDRLLRVDRAILRISVNELLFTKAAPTGVTINEAVELAKSYSDQDSYRMINGVLASVNKNEEAE